MSRKIADLLAVLAGLALVTIIMIYRAGLRVLEFIAFAITEARGGREWE